MMSSSTDLLLWLYVALVFLAAMALMISALPRWARVALLLASFGLYVVAEDVLEGVWGWPSRQALPPRFVLLSAVIEEPTKQGDGGVYVWLQSLPEGGPPGRPRAFRLAYEKDLHALINEALVKTRQGVTQMGMSEARPGEAGPSVLRPGNAQQVLKIVDLPAAQLPEK
jgi:hypothetical protein